MCAWSGMVRRKLEIHPAIVYWGIVIKSWVDAHTNLPDRARWFAKSDVAPRSNEAASVGPPAMEGFVFLGTHLAAFARSRIPSGTIEAYLATEYRVDEPSRFTLLIGRHHQGLAALLAGHKAGSAAVLTACNPYSKIASKTGNERAQRNLADELDRRRLVHFPAHGVDPEEKWPAEESLLVLGISLEEAADLGEKFRQTGAVWAAGDALPMLLLLR